MLNVRLSEDDTVKIVNNYNNTGDNVIIRGNTLGAALPGTGGPGTNLIYLLGLMLAGIAGAGLLIMSKSRQKAA